MFSKLRQLEQDIDSSAKISDYKYVNFKEQIDAAVNFAYDNELAALSMCCKECEEKLSTKYGIKNEDITDANIRAAL